jgi:hypothetical protein
MVKNWDRVFQKVFKTAKPAIKGGHPHRQVFGSIEAGRGRMLIDAPLSSTALSSQLAEQPRRVAQPVIENTAGHIKKGADKRVA